MHVELDIFSGRPNPAWQLDEVAAGEVRRLVAALSPSTARAANPPGLGYRGFICTESGKTWRAFKGTVTWRDEVLADQDRTVERFLLEQLPADHVNLRQKIAQELL